MSTQEETQSENCKNKRKSSQVPSTKAYWDAKSNEIFIKLYVDLVKVGHSPGTHLDRVGWKNVISKFKIMTGKSIPTNTNEKSLGCFEKRLASME